METTTNTLEEITAQEPEEQPQQEPAPQQIGEDTPQEPTEEEPTQEIEEEPQQETLPGFIDFDKIMGLIFDIHSDFKVLEVILDMFFDKITEGEFSEISGKAQDAIFVTETVYNTFKEPLRDNINTALREIDEIFLS